MGVHGSSRPLTPLGTADEIELVKAILGAYATAIDIWPDNVAVSPSLIARRTFRPSQNIDEPTSAAPVVWPCVRLH
jgi:hypothetical protein